MKNSASCLAALTAAVVTFNEAASAASSAEGIQGYMLRAAVDRSDIAGRDWENPVELIAFSKPAPAPAPEPSPAPAPAPESEAAPVTAGALPCEEYSRFANKWHVETVRVSWTDEQKDQFCDRLKVASLYETLWTDFFGMTAQQMFPENTAPNIHWRERWGNTTPHIHGTATSMSDGKFAFGMSYGASYLDETALLDFPNVTTVTVEYLESRAAQFGYCANNFERGVSLQDYHGPDYPAEGWYWSCDISLTHDQYPNYGILLYHPNRATPMAFRVTVQSSNA